MGRKGQQFRDIDWWTQPHRKSMHHQEQLYL
jgi:hypothetical protein